MDEAKPGYDGLYVLNDGDHLTIVDPDTPEKAVWSGVVALEYESNQQRSSYNPKYIAQAVFNHWVHGLQRGINAETWAEYFFTGFPMKFERDAQWEVFRPDSERNVYHRGLLTPILGLDRQYVAMLSVKYARFEARGASRFLYKLESEANMYLTAEDLRNL